MDQVSKETKTLIKRHYELSSIQEQGIKLYNQALAGIKDSAIPISIGPHNLSMIQALTFPYEPETLAAADELFIYVPKLFPIAPDTIKLLDESFASEEEPGFNPPQDAARRLFKQISL